MNKKVRRIKIRQTTQAALRQRARLWKFPDGNLQRGEKKKTRRDEDDGDEDGGRRWYELIYRGDERKLAERSRKMDETQTFQRASVKRTISSLRGGGKGARERGERRSSPFPSPYDRSNPFARTIDSLKRATVFSDFPPSRYLHIKISLTPSLKIILRLPFFFSPTLRSRRVSCNWRNVGKQYTPVCFSIFSFSLHFNKCVKLEYNWLVRKVIICARLYNIHDYFSSTIKCQMMD